MFLHQRFVYRFTIYDHRSLSQRYINTTLINPPSASSTHIWTISINFQHLATSPMPIPGTPSETMGKNVQKPAWKRVSSARAALSKRGNVQSQFRGGHPCIILIQFAFVYVPYCLLLIGNCLYAIYDFDPILHVSDPQMLSNANLLVYTCALLFWL